MTVNWQQIEAVATRVGAGLQGTAAAAKFPTGTVSRDPYTPLSPGAAGRDLASFIDHTLLKPAATPAEVAQLCAEARTHAFASVCVNPTFIRQCSEALRGSGVKVCTVIGFPLGATSSAAKAAESRLAVADGAEEVDMVIPVGRLKAGEFSAVYDDIAAVVGGAQGRLVKVIIETALLTDEEKIAACLLSKLAGADFVKTSTGFSGGGATAEDIALMRAVVGPKLGVKASGGVRDEAAARAMIAAGATRIGTSSGVAIVQSTRPAGTGY